MSINLNVIVMIIIVNTKINNIDKLHPWQGRMSSFQGDLGLDAGNLYYVTFLI